MIIFSEVTKQFGDNPPSIDRVSFMVEEAEFVFLTGHSGSGKTTLFKLLTKEYLPNSGEIEFEGQKLSKLKSSKVHTHRRKIGVVYQDYRLLPELNVWENIAIALQIIGKPQAEIEERVTDLLELVQLTDKAYFFPAELSGGESQRVGIARALATAPSVILADEPTGNLDPENTLMIARLFSKINELGTTILFATHDLSVLDHLGHRRLKLEKGQLIEDKPSTELKKEKVSPAEESSEITPSAPAPESTPTPPPEHTQSTETKKVEKQPDSPVDQEKKSQKEEKTVAEPTTEKEPEKPKKPTDEEVKEILEEIEQEPRKPRKAGLRLPSFQFSLFGRKSKTSEPEEKSETESTNDTQSSSTPEAEKTSSPVLKDKTTHKPPVDIIIEEL